MKRILLIAAVALCALAQAQQQRTMAGASPGGNSPYATDAYPGFDDLDEMKEHLAKYDLKPDLEFSHGQMREMIFYASEKTHGVEIAINEFPDANGCAIEVARDMGYDPR